MSVAQTNLKLKILSDPANLAPVRQSVESLCAANGVEKRTCDEIGLCVNEAMANVIVHAYRSEKDKPIEIDAQVDEDVVTIRIRDWGNGVNPSELPEKPRDPMTPGGLGLICLRKMMSSVAFTPQSGGGMLLEMTRKRSS